MRSRTDNRWVNGGNARGMVPAGSPSVSSHCLLRHLDSFKNILCKVQTLPLKSTWRLETLAHKAKPHQGPSLFSARGGRGFAFSFSPCRKRMESMLAWLPCQVGCPTSSGGGTQPLTAIQPRPFEQVMVQPTLHEAQTLGVCVPTTGASWAVVADKASPDLERWHWVISCLLKGLPLHVWLSILPADPQISRGSLHIVYATSTKLLPMLIPPQEKKIRLKATVLLLNYEVIS